MKKKVLIRTGVIVIVLLTGLIGYFVASSGSEPTMIIQPMPTQPMPTQPTPTQPTPTPTTNPNQEVIRYRDPSRGTVKITGQELIKKALANRLSGDTLFEISGVYGENLEKTDKNGDFYFLLGPEIDGFYIVAKVSKFAYGNIVRFGNLPEGNKITFEGKYERTEKMEFFDKGFNKSYNVVIMADCELIYEGK